MAECAYCGDEVVGKGVSRNSRMYCSNECAEYDEEEIDEEEDFEDEGDAEDE